LAESVTVPVIAEVVTPCARTTVVPANAINVRIKQIFQGSFMRISSITGWLRGEVWRMSNPGVP
jgi:hypothetical protein